MERLTERAGAGMNNDLISRSALEEEMWKRTSVFDKEFKRGLVYQCIREAPTIDASPVVRGEWNGWTTSAYMGLDEDGEPKVADRKYYRCSECRYGTVVRSNYCPSCGAKMKGGE